MDCRPDFPAHHRRLYGRGCRERETGLWASPTLATVDLAASTIRYAWRAPFDNAEVNALHAAAFAHRLHEDDWWSQCERHSLGWVDARSADRLVGFVNVAWDGGVHAFLLDTMVGSSHRRSGIGTELVRIAADRAAQAGCEWLHVDFEEHLRGFYLVSGGFRTTGAGLISLRSDRGPAAPG